jgi:hypothetical protein
VDAAVVKIRILLVGMPRMLNAIIRNAIAAEADMTIVEHIAADTDLGSFTRRRRIDVVLFSAGDCVFTDASIDRLLRANPRLGLLAVHGVQDRGVLHHLVPACKEVCPLSRSSLTEAIRAGAALRRA